MNRETGDPLRLAAFDLDGTLLRDDKTISPGTMAALERAAEAGVVLVPATGRIYGGMPEAVCALPFVRYAITVNGAEVYDVKEDKVLYAAEIAMPEARRVLDYMDTLPALRGCYQLGRGWMTPEDYERIEEYADGPLLDMMRTVYRPLENLWEAVFRKHPTVQKLQVYFHDEAAKRRALAEMLERFPEFEITSSIPINIEINAAGATKGAALAFLAGHLGLTLDRCMALGDGSNDVSMLKAAGYGVAMGNADPAVRAAAQYVTDTNENDGAAKALLRFLS